MAYLHSTGEVIIHAGNFHEFLPAARPQVAGQPVSFGLRPRDYGAHPLGSYPWAKAVDFTLIDQTEWAQRLTDLQANNALLSQIRATGNNGQSIPSRDQNGKGYCWAHSGTSAHLLLRAVNGQPYADLSAFSIACQIKNFQDEGGWGAQGVDWQIKYGVATSKTWPQQSMSRSNVNDAMKADALQHLIADQWADLNHEEYDRNLTFQQLATLLLTGCPCVTDFNWWSHSVCGADIVNGNGMLGLTRMPSGKLCTLPEFEAVWGINDPVTAGFGLRIWNSWSDSWSQQGMGVLTGQQAIPNGGVGVRSVKLSAA